jgi:alkaline phosphatase
VLRSAFPLRRVYFNVDGSTSLDPDRLHTTSVLSVTTGSKRTDARGGVSLKHKYAKWIGAAVAVLALATAATRAGGVFDGQDDRDDDRSRGSRRAKNVILFIGDGMGVSTVTATRVYSVGVAGQLVVDQFPYTALSRTYSSDSITPDSAPTMTAMMTGRNTNAGVLGLDETTESSDFNGDGDGRPLRTLLEQAKRNGMKVGVVSTARITHATPAATYAHINNRDDENAIALQSLPTDASYNDALGDGIDVTFGGGRRHFVSNTVLDEESARGSRTDSRDHHTCWSIGAASHGRSRPLSARSTARRGAMPADACSRRAVD